MRDDVDIRSALGQDVPSIARLSARFAAEDLLVDRTVAHFHSRIGNYLAAVSVDRVVGCVGLTRIAGDLLVYNLCVATDFQGHGIGGRLLDEAEARAVLRGCQGLLAASKHSGRWFTGRGFVEIDPPRLSDPRAELLPRGRGSRLYRRAVVVPPRITPDSARS